MAGRGTPRPASSSGQIERNSKCFASTWVQYRECLWPPSWRTSLPSRQVLMPTGIPVTKTLQPLDDRVIHHYIRAVSIARSSQGRVLSRVIAEPSVAVHHHGGVADNKIRELNRANAGATHLENRHIDIGPELHLMDRQALLARSSPGTARQFGGGVGHAEMAEGIVTPAVMDLQSFNTHSGEIENQDHIGGIPVQAAVGHLKMGVELQFRARDGIAIGQGAGRAATVTDDEIRGADVALEVNV